LITLGAGAPLVDAQQWFEGLERGAVDVERVRQQLADGRPPAGFVEGLRVSGPEEQIIGHATGVRVTAEKRADIALEADRQCRDRRAPAESS
jgi:hypothetical protein